MASTVNNAFADFLRDTVNLDSDETKIARNSRDWLIGQINNLSSKDSYFPVLYQEEHLYYGSFARRTKIRPLDDIDLLACMSAQFSTYLEYNDRIELTVGQNADRLKRLCHDGTHLINSIKVINQFVKSLGAVSHYKKADIKRNQQAAVLNLSSYAWSYDIVPCFMTALDSWGKTYYLIPDGKGHWMKTDPRIDKEQATSINQQHSGRVLNVLRLMKFWTKRPIAPTIPSYLLETMVFNYYANKTSETSSYPDVEIPYVLDYLANAINWDVEDPKGIQGNINKLTFDTRKSISEMATSHAKFAREARQHESNGDHKASIKSWQQVFGPYFPYFD
jgi:hypothetical protein